MTAVDIVKELLTTRCQLEVGVGKELFVLATCEAPRHLLNLQAVLFRAMRGVDKNIGDVEKKVGVHRRLLFHGTWRAGGHADGPVR